MKTKYQDKNGNESMGRYLAHRGLWAGIYLTGLSFIMLVISFFMNKDLWSGTFSNLCIIGIGLITACVAGKTISTKFENGYHNDALQMKGD